MGILPWVLLLSALVPFDIPFDLPHLPPLSIIDYLCVPALAFAVFQKGPTHFFSYLPKRLGRPAFFLCIAFAGWVLLSAFLTNGNMRGPLRWGEFLFCFILGRMALESSENARLRFAQGLCLMGSAIALFGLIQCIQSRGDHTHVYATFRQHNVFAAYLSPCLFASVALCTNQKDKTYAAYAGSLLLIAAAMLASASRGAWAGLLLASAVYLFLLKNRAISRMNLLSLMMALTVLIPLATVALHPQMGRLDQWSATTHYPSDTKPETLDQSLKNHALTLSQRPAYWSTAWRIARTHPWVGLGPGGYARHLRDYLDGRAQELYDYELKYKKRVDFWQHLHSMYLQLLVEYGFPGLLLWILAMSALASPALTRISPDASAIDRMMPLALIAFMAHNSVDILFVNSIDLLMAFIMAIWA